MDTLKLKALAALRWVWDRIAHVSKVIWSKAVAIGNTLYDPPPVAYKRLFFTALAIFVAGGLTFSFVNSWYYKPTAAYFASWVGEDSYMLPEIEPLPPVPTPASVVPSVEIVCQDMSDTPHCGPVYETPEKRSQGTQTEVEVNPPPVAKSPADTKKKIRIYKKRKPVRYQTYWGF